MRKADFAAVSSADYSRILKTNMKENVYLDRVGSVDPFFLLNLFFNLL